MGCVIAAVFPDLGSFEPCTLQGLFDDKTPDMGMVGECLASHDGQDTQGHQVLRGHALEQRQVLVVGGCKHRMIERPMQPGPHRLHPPKVEAPVTLVQAVRCNDELKASA